MKIVAIVALGFLLLFSCVIPPIQLEFENDIIDMPDWGQPGMSMPTFIFK